MTEQYPILTARLNKVEIQQIKLAAHGFERQCRVNGVAGKISYQNGKLLVNGKPLDASQTQAYYRDAQQVLIKSGASSYEVSQVDTAELFRLTGLVLKQNFIAEQLQTCAAAE